MSNRSRGCVNVLDPTVVSAGQSNEQEQEEGVVPSRSCSRCQEATSGTTTATCKPLPLGPPPPPPPMVLSPPPAPPPPLLLTAETAAAGAGVGQGSMFISATARAVCARSLPLSLTAPSSC